MLVSHTRGCRMQSDKKRLRVQRGESWANVADIGTKVLSNAVIAKHSLALEYSNMDSDGCRLQNQEGKDRDGSKKGTEVRVQIDQRSAAAGHLARVHADKSGSSNRFRYGSIDRIQGRSDRQHWTPRFSE